MKATVCAFVLLTSTASFQVLGTEVHKIGTEAARDDSANSTTQAQYLGYFGYWHYFF